MTSTKRQPRYYYPPEPLWYPTKPYSMWAWLVGLPIGLLILSLGAGVDGLIYLGWEKYHREPSVTALAPVAFETPAPSALPRENSVENIKIPSLDYGSGETEVYQGVRQTIVKVCQGAYQTVGEVCLGVHGFLKSRKKVPAPSIIPVAASVRHIPLPPLYSRAHESIDDYMTGFSAVFWKRLKNQEWSGPITLHSDTGVQAFGYRVRGNIRVIDQDRERWQTIPRNCYFILDEKAKVLDFQVVNGGWDSLKRWER
ncbi:MAG: hypothetical protein KGL39_00555 [Patescibacteria group bacterium]|nr:hypothetical protein [Patescibacteria group bacterium]